MIEFVINNWVWITAFSITGFVAYLLAFQLAGGWQTLAMAAVSSILFLGSHELDVYRFEAKETADLAAAATALNAQFKKDEKITTGVSNAYQTNLSGLNQQYDSLVGVQLGGCSKNSAAGTSGGHDATAAKRKLPKPDGGNFTAALYKLGRDAEQSRLQLISCQSFINQTWAAQGQ